MSEKQRLNRKEIEELASNALIASGALETSAKSLAKAVASAEMDGIKSHGLVYVPIYCEHLQCGKVVGSAVPKVERPAKGAVVVDACSGFAHPAIDAGFSELVPAAKEMGCAGMSIRNSYNCGVLGHHVERLAESGLVGIGFTNAPASIMPVGGNKTVIGTNPFALSVPGEQGPELIIDQSASVVAKSEIKMHAQAGKAIPEGWALDPSGNPTTDPDEALKGSMAPVGGYKGFGTGLMVELMAAVLAGATLGLDASPFAGTAGGPPNTGQFFIALSPDSFSGSLYKERLSRLVGAIGDQPGSRIPGSRRWNHRKDHEANGVEVDPKIITTVQNLAEGSN